LLAVKNRLVSSVFAPLKITEYFVQHMMDNKHAHAQEYTQYCA